MKKEIKRKNMISVSVGVMVIALTLIVMGSSYAWLTLTLNGTKENVIKTGNLALNLDDSTSTGINLTNGVPMLDEVALTKEGYTFTLENTGNINSEYTIYLDDIPLLDGEDKLEDRYIKYNIQGSNSINTTKLLSELPTSPNRSLDTGIIKPGEKYTYTLRLWIDSESDNNAMNKTFRSKIRVEATQIKEQLVINTLVKPTIDWNSSTLSTGYFWDYKENITKIVFQNKISEIANPVKIWDLSEKQDKSITGYLTGTQTEGYTVYIQSDGEIYANENSSHYFSKMEKLVTIEGLEYLNTSKVTNMSYMFSDCSSFTQLNLSNFDTSNVTSMVGMFIGCISLTQLDVSSFNTSNVTNMSIMFSVCIGLPQLNLSNFNTSKVTNMLGMFGGCNSLTQLDLSNFNTSNVTNMSAMFGACSGLTQLNLSSFDTSNVTSMVGMFQECSSLTQLDLSNFNTSNVTSMDNMFYNCSSLTQLDLSNFNTSKVKDMSSMFSNCYSLTQLDLSNFNFSLVTRYDGIFSFAPTTTTIKVKDVASQSWVIAKGTGFSPTNVIIKTV